MKLTPELIHGFAGSVLSYRYDNAVASPDCHKEWWEYCCSSQPFVAIAAPRGHAKSTAITHAYTLAAVLFQDRKFVLLVSDTYDQAVMFLADIRSELEDNDLLIDLFGEMKFEKDAENDIIVRMADGNKFRIVAKGSEQKVRGLKWDGKRPDLIVGDDLENDEIVMNPERRLKFKEWFTGALLPCRSKYGIVRLVGTILHMDSLLENLMPKYSDKKYTVETPLKVYSTRARSAWLAVKYRAHSKDYSQILWPESKDAAWFKEERQRYADLGIPEKYTQEYLNEPIDETKAFFRKADLIPMSEEDYEDVDFKKGTAKFYMAVDFAISEKERADYTVMVVGAVDAYNILHIVDVVRGRMDAKEIIDNIMALNTRYQPDIVTVESGAIEKAIGPFLKAEMFDSGNFINLNPMTPIKDKESRARSIQGRMRAGGVHFDKRAEWFPDFEQELLTFPRSVHDDQVDALAWLGLTLNKMQMALTPEEQEEEEYESLLFESGYFDEGRCRSTGY